MRKNSGLSLLNTTGSPLDLCRERNHHGGKVTATNHA
jgi:hypothetical protein